MNAAPGPPAHGVPVEAARAAHSAEAERLCGPGEPVAEIGEVTVPAAACACAPTAPRSRRRTVWAPAAREAVEAVGARLRAALAVE